MLGYIESSTWTMSKASHTQTVSAATWVEKEPHISDFRTREVTSE